MTTNQSTSINIVQHHKSTKMKATNQDAEIQGNSTNSEAQTIKTGFEELLKKVDNLTTEKKFPVEVFPKTLQELIYILNKTLNFSIDYSASSLLFAISVAIGNTYKLRFKENWEESAVLYLCLVGRPGAGKTPPLNFMLKPIKKEDGINYAKYKEEKRLYTAMERQSKKSREATPVDAPSWKQHLLSDFTLEALLLAHSVNPRGLGVHSDELASWFKNFNRYSNGSEEQFWLSAWSGNPIRINRKTSEPIYISKPFISVVGGIQPNVLLEFADNRQDNGFLDRFLFAFPKHIRKKGWNRKNLKKGLVDSYFQFIERLLNDLPRTEENNYDPQFLNFTDEASDEIHRWQEEMVNFVNEQDDDLITSIIAKIEVYALRFSIILEIANFGFNGIPLQSIGIDSVKGAIKLAEYFFSGSLKVHKLLQSATPVMKLDQQKRRIYDGLPSNFTTNQAVEIADRFSLSERSIKRFLKQDCLFKRIKTGYYQKLY